MIAKTRRIAPCAFTLVEVLIAVLVLALGLLGLAAVFPVVVHEQRTASDAIQGSSVLNSTMTYLSAQGLLNEPGDDKGWRRLLRESTWSPDGEWVTPDMLAGIFGVDRLTGMMSLGDGTVIGNPPPIFLPVGERLFPWADGPGGPRFVWDFVARRVPAGRAGVRVDDWIQIAVFLRRIDAGIRIPPGATLGAVLQGGVVARDRRVPVAVDSRGRPTYRGSDENNAPNYAVPSEIFVVGFGRDEFGRSRSDLPIFDGTYPVQWQLLMQVGQKFVDITGQVHTVVGFWDDPEDAGEDPNAARITPAFSSEALAIFAATSGPGLQLVMTPQTPAAVSVVTIRR